LVRPLQQGTRFVGAGTCQRAQWKAAARPTKETGRSPFAGGATLHSPMRILRTEWVDTWIPSIGIRISTRDISLLNLNLLRGSFLICVCFREDAGDDSGSDAAGGLDILAAAAAAGADAGGGADGDGDGEDEPGDDAGRSRAAGGKRVRSCA
jgi:hypothetical protein